VYGSQKASKRIEKRKRIRSINDLGRAVSQGGEALFQLSSGDLFGGGADQVGNSGVERKDGTGEPNRGTCSWSQSLKEKKGH